ncbi:xylulokinase [Rathayibacter sp. Leaf296]|uniref:xylulokinase n=1 Tax=Rathayibacter sp. Leaf296 TaxID=1736327 RepID=UPI00070259F3|nr:FGGY family carbohydrate kinase [Rathayibacter sp. Leaf296]KQQ08745.1 hypothetical protein ASF46_15975 [Rathayibacter sp. Leaf296]
MPDGDLVVAIDCSTTASKAVAVDAGGRTVATARHSFPVLSPGEGRFEQDARAWWTTTFAALHEVVESVGGERVAALTITHQRETFVCLDGDPVRPAMLWMDKRAGSQLERLRAESIHARTGRPADLTPSFYKLAWMADEEPELLARSTRVGDVSAYLTLQLTGRWASSSASADSMGMIDLSLGDWDDELCRLAGVDRRVLPDLVAPGTSVAAVLPEIAETLGLTPGTPVIAAAGDGQCAALGAGLVEPGDIYLNLGTAEVCGTLVTDYQWHPEYRTVAAAAGHGFLLEAFLASGTSLVNWYREEFGSTDPDELDRLTQAISRLPAGSGNLVSLPYWLGLQSPAWDERASGAVIGWRPSHTRAHFYRSLLEGIAFEIATQIDVLETASGMTGHRVLCTGGGSRSVVWTQIVADVLDRPVVICDEPETTALGAAILAAVAAGLHHSLDDAIAAMSRAGVVMRPDPSDAAVYRALRSIRDGLYSILRPTFHALSALH